MSYYLNSATETLKPYGESAMHFLTGSKNAVTSTFSSGVETISGVSSSVMSTISDAGSNLASQVQYLKNKAVNMVTTIRMTAHGSVDGMLIGMGVGLVVAGPMGVGYGAWIGSVAGGIYGFSEATNNDFDRASHAAQQKQWRAL